MNFTNSERLHNEALEHIVGGVNSPSRSYKAVGGGSPVVMERGQGAYFFDVDGNQYIDYLAAYGPIITGFAHPHITEAIKKAAESGVLFGTPTTHEITLAKMILFLLQLALVLLHLEYQILQGSQKALPKKSSRCHSIPSNLSKKH